MPEHDTTTPRGAPLTNLARLRFRITESLRTLEGVEPWEMTEESSTASLKTSPTPFVW